MYIFRSFIYGISQFLMILWIIGLTTLGAAAPAALDLLVPRTSRLSPYFDNNGLANLLGAVVGFSISALTSAVLFALIEVAINTRQLRATR